MQAYAMEHCAHFTKSVQALNRTELQTVENESKLLVGKQPGLFGKVFITLTVTK